jgi:hypothetical protein
MITQGIQKHKGRTSQPLSVLGSPKATAHHRGLSHRYGLKHSDTRQLAALIAVASNLLDQAPHRTVLSERDVPTEKLTAPDFERADTGPSAAADSLDAAPPGCFH